MRQILPSDGWFTLPWRVALCCAVCWSIVERSGLFRFWCVFYWYRHLRTWHALKGHPWTLISIKKWTFKKGKTVKLSKKWSFRPKKQPFMALLFLILLFGNNCTVIVLRYPRPELVVSQTKFNLWPLKNFDVFPSRIPSTAICFVFLWYKKRF